MGLSKFFIPEKLANFHFWSLKKYIRSLISWKYKFVVLAGSFILLSDDVTYQVMPCGNDPFVPSPLNGSKPSGWT